MTKLLFILVVQALISVMAIFGSNQKKPGENASVIQCIVRFIFSCGFYPNNLNKVYLLSWILKKRKKHFRWWDESVGKITHVSER